MRKIVLSFAFSSLIFASELGNFLSPLYNDIFELEQKKSLTQKKLNSLSWISPITLSFERNWNNQIVDGWHPRNSYSIGIEQPIFRSGGILYGIEFAKSNYNLAKATTIDKRVKLNTQAAELLFKIKQVKLSIAKLKLELKNRDIEIKNAKELFNAGLFGSDALDNALIKKDATARAILDLESNLQELKSAFKKISNKDLNSAQLPHLRLLSKDEYLANNTQLMIAKAKSISSKNYAKVVRSKYLPSVSVGARYTKISKAQPGSKDAFTNYSLRVSMPISVNTFNDLEVAKLDSLIDGLNVKNSLKAARIEYDSVVKNIAIINKRVKLAKKELASYKRLLRSTQNLYKAGQKSSLDVKVLKNSLQEKRLDIKIFGIQKSLEMLKLYSKVDI